ncbi:DUF5004 domain-containing protein [Niabella insulamsoli]|uniref:DUF5004 domain-containing protein n=1 Tax=Niabella insulamsoli TaxID=3144874 RepID=UPI0031FDCFE5
MMKQYRYAALIAAFFVVAGLVYSCTKETTRAIPEAAKNIAGSWKIVSVSRNGVDITNFFDFTGFNIEFRQDGSYTINNPVPFIVSQNGSWSLDDPTHPLRISFTQANTSQTIINEFNYPVVGGARQIILTGSPGCTANTYQYALEAVK